MDIIQISVHPKSSLCLLKTPSTMQDKCFAPVSAEQASFPVWQGRGDQRKTWHIYQPEGCRTLLHVWHSEVQWLCIPDVLGLLMEVRAKLSFLVIYHTSAQGQSLDESTLNTHSLSKTVFLKKT